jgi:nucleoside phosphorylase
VVVADPAVESGQEYRTVPASGGGRFVRGVLITVDHIVRTAEEKRALGATGAKVVDMEAGGVAERSQELAVPFLSVKAVTDLAWETLANDFQRALRPDGLLDTIEVLESGLRRPMTRIPELIRLWVRCARASRALGVFFADCRI